MPTWKVLGASVQGVDHKKQGIPCQDAHVYRELSNGSLLIALADGSGSASHSQEGAEFAVKRALESLERQFASLIKPTISHSSHQELYRSCFIQAFKEVRQGIGDLAVNLNGDAKEFACTLTMFFADSDHLAAAQIGDGAVILKTNRGEYVTLMKPQRGEYANETYFITHEKAEDLLNIQFYDGKIQFAAALTDGLLNISLINGSHQPYSKFFDPLMTFTRDLLDLQSGLKNLNSFLASERVCAKTHDDKTLVLAVALPGVQGMAERGE
jgi:hypothetical protein